MNSKRFNVAILQNLQDGKQYYLDDTYHVIGRSNSCNIVVKDQTLSRQHARIWYENSDWYIMDCTSTNGVTVNGRKIYPDEPYRLYDDTEIILASGIRFRFWCGQCSDDSTITSEEVSHSRYGAGVPNSQEAENSSVSWSNLEVYVLGVDAFKENYWPCILVALLQSIGPGLFVVWLQSGSLMSIIHGQSVDLLVFTVMSVLMILLRIFVFNPLNVGCSRFFVLNCNHDSAIGETFFAFSNRYLSVIKEMLIRDVQLFVWFLIFVVPFITLTALFDTDAISLLALPLIIPYIIKCYDYRLVPHLIAMEKQQTGRSSLQASKDRINGYRRKVIILDLLFLALYLLGIITMGLLYIFFVNPCKYSTNGQIYCQLSKCYHNHQGGNRYGFGL